MKDLAIYFIQHEDNRKVALLMNGDKLMCNTIPSTESRQTILRRINKSGKDLDNIEVVDLPSHPVADVLFGMDKNPQTYWEAACQIEIDYNLYTENQREVFERLRQTSPGETISYGKLARQSGFGKGARFVGNCMRSNHIPLILPCHRVVKSDGSLGQYSAFGGTQTKKRYLKLEGVRDGDQITK